MISYELAKELNETGFPVNTAGYPLWITDPKQGETSEPYIVPTLEELVEACSETRFGLYKVEQGWHAQKTDTEVTAKGATPTEAVAKLYLALYNKGNATTNKNTGTN